MLSKNILLSLATVAAVSVAAIGGTYASFTATPTTIASNAFTTGTLSMTSSGSGAIFSAGNMKIGDSATGSITVNNTGTLAADYLLNGAITGNATLAGSLKLKIYADADNSGTAIFDGSLDGVSNLDLGTFAATSGSHTYYFHISLPTTGSAAGDNALQGKTATAAFTWTATQA